MSPSSTTPAPTEKEQQMPNEYRFYKPLNPLSKRPAAPCEGPCTCTPEPDYPVQPPAPTAEQVREAREYFNPPWPTPAEVSIVWTHAHTILAALDRAQGEVADLRPEYHYAEPSDTKWAKATSLLCNYIREHAHDPYRKALLEAVDALLEAAEKNARHNTRLLVCFDHMRKQKLALRAENARLVEEVASWKALVQHKCGVVRGMVRFCKLAREGNAAQAEQIKRLEAVVKYINSGSHRDGCATEWGLSHTCTCGLDMALKEASK